MLEIKRLRQNQMKSIFHIVYRTETFVHVFWQPSSSFELHLQHKEQVNEQLYASPEQLKTILQALRGIFSTALFLYHQLISLFHIPILRIKYKATERISYYYSCVKVPSEVLPNVVQAQVTLAVFNQQATSVSLKANFLHFLY